MPIFYKMYLKGGFKLYVLTYRVMTHEDIV